MNKEKIIPVIIPAYEPNEDFVEICNRIHLATDQPIIVVNDGNDERYDHIFKKISEDGYIVIKHAVNLGKGRGLKTAFNYILNTYTDIIGVVTADSDGQHKPEDIQKVMIALRDNPTDLILGTRNFEGENIPWKSSFGNKLTRVICNYLCGVKVTDTQTGLRGIPKNFIKVLMNVQGERFEFETRMLIETKDNMNIIEVPIDTVYESKDNHNTHFDPILDSIRIYRIFGALFLKYIISSVTSFVVDIILFALFCKILKNNIPIYYVGIATVIARIISSIYNFAVNYGLVFNSEKKKSEAGVKYFILAIAIMLMSATLTTIGVNLFNPVSEAIIKIIVDTLLFLVSYKVQQKWIYL